MKKLYLGAAVTAALFSGVANAAPPVINPATTYEIFLSGASAPRVFLEKLLTDATVPVANRLCANPAAVIKFQDNVNGANQNAYYCVGNTANPVLAPLLTGVKKNILLYKRSSGGSIYGVNPIVLDTLAGGQVAFLKIDPTCTGTGPYVCAGTQLKTPDFGVSDVDPGKFTGSNYPLPAPAGWTPITAAGVAKLNVLSGPSQVFGIVVNTTFRNALQAAQGKVVGSELAANQPSLTSLQVANILKGTYTAGAGLPALTAGKSLHMCGRTNGSGTKATTAIKFLNYPCAAGAASPKADTGAATTAGTVLVHQMASSGNLDECLSELNSGTNTVGTAFNNIWGAAWAIGYQGTENNANGNVLTPVKPYRFVKINGVASTLANVFANTYKDWTDLTFQYNKTHVFDANELAIVKEIIKEAGQPTVVGKLDDPDATHIFGQAGYMGSPVFWTPATPNLPNPVNRYSHATRVPALPVNDCKVITAPY